MVPDRRTLRRWGRYADAIAEFEKTLVTPNSRFDQWLKGDQQAITQTELEDFLARVPDDVLVVVDEAYLEFVEGEGEVDGLSLRREHGNVMLLRTFSKAYGLAGLRVGYAVAPEPVAEALRKTATPFGVNLIVHRTNKRLEADLERIVAHQVPLVITSLGAVKEVVDAVHSYGGLVCHDVTNAKHAAKAAAAVMGMNNADSR